TRPAWALTRSLARSLRKASASAGVRRRVCCCVSAMVASIPERLMPLHPAITAWFAQRGWEPRRHQLEVLRVTETGASAMLIAPTGAGKTLAGFLPTINELSERPQQGIHTLYLSPLKALAVDVARNLTTPIAEMGLGITVETRTGDTPAHRKQRQRQTPPNVLMT